MKATVIRAEALIVAFLTAISKGDLEKCKKLINHGVYADCRDERGNSPLMMTASRPQGLLLCQLLIGAGAAVNGTNVLGGNPSLKRSVGR